MAGREINWRTYARAIIAVAMMMLWSLVLFSGYLLWLVPHGPRSGQTVLLFGLSKREWGDWHLWFSVAASLVTLAHLVVDWRGFCGCMKYLASVHRVDGENQPKASTLAQPRVQQ